MSSDDTVSAVCKGCEALQRRESRVGAVYFACDCRCGRPANSGHPLSPCVRFCSEDEEPDCETCEEYLLDGRCYTYCVWLDLMNQIRNGDA